MKGRGCVGILVTHEIEIVGKRAIESNPPLVWANGSGTVGRALNSGTVEADQGVGRAIVEEVSPILGEGEVGDIARPSLDKSLGPGGLVDAVK